MRFIKCLCMGLIVLGLMGGGALATPTELSPPELADVLERTTLNLGQIQQLKTRVRQEKKIPLFTEPVTSRGLCLFKRPDKLRLEFIDPFKSILVSDGKQLRKYTQFQGKWKRLKAGDAAMSAMVLDQINGWLSGRFNDKDLYRITGNRTDQGITLVLTPKNPEFRQHIQAFELGLKPQLDGLRQIRIRVSDEDITTIVFHHDDTRGEIPDALFTGDETPPPPVPEW